MGVILIFSHTEGTGWFMPKHFFCFYLLKLAHHVNNKMMVCFQLLNVIKIVFIEAGLVAFWQQFSYRQDKLFVPVLIRFDSWYDITYKVHLLSVMERWLFHKYQTVSYQYIDHFPHLEHISMSIKVMYSTCTFQKERPNS